MKKPATKWVIVAVLTLLVGYSGFATHNWLEGKGIAKATLNYAVDLSDIHLWEVSEVGLVAEHLIEPDITDELVTQEIICYAFHARTLLYSSSMLQTLTNDNKYRAFGTAMFDLQAFFIELNNRSDRKETLATNLDALREMDDVLDGILQISSITLADAEKLVQICGNLTVG